MHLFITWRSHARHQGRRAGDCLSLQLEKYNSYDTEVADLTIDYIKRNADGEKPFFVYYAGKGNHFFGANPDFMNTPAERTMPLR